MMKYAKFDWEPGRTVYKMLERSPTYNRLGGVQLVYKPDERAGRDGIPMVVVGKFMLTFEALFRSLDMGAELVKCTTYIDVQEGQMVRQPVHEETHLGNNRSLKHVLRLCFVQPESKTRDELLSRPNVTKAKQSGQSLACQ